MKTKHQTWITETMTLYQGSLISYTYGFTGSHDQARDVVQDTFIKLCEKSKEDFDDGLKSWLYTVCRNGALQVLRKGGRMSELTEVTMMHYQEQSPSPAKSTEQKDQFGHVLQLIEKLPVNQQEVIRLKYNHQMSYQEISEISSLTVTNIGFLLHTGLQKLRLEMSKLQEVAR